MRDEIPHELPGDGSSPAAGTIWVGGGDDVFIPLVRPATERLGSFTSTLVRMAALAKGEPESVRAVFWLDQDPMLAPKDSRDLISWELDR